MARKAHVGFTLDRGVLAAIDVMAAGERRPRANMMEVLFLEALEARGVRVVADVPSGGAQ